MASRSFLLPPRWLSQRLAANPKFRHATDYDGSPSGLANGSGRSALPKRSHGANLSVQSPIFRGMPVEAPSAICTASRSGLFSRGRSKAANLVNVHIHQFQPGGAIGMRCGNSGRAPLPMPSASKRSSRRRWRRMASRRNDQPARKAW
jgi:hypothetical protein